MPEPGYLWVLSSCCVGPTAACLLGLHFLLCSSGDDGWKSRTVTRLGNTHYWKLWLVFHLVLCVLNVRGRNPLKYKCVGGSGQLIC